MARRQALEHSLRMSDDGGAADAADVNFEATANAIAARSEVWDDLTLHTDLDRPVLNGVVLQVSRHTASAATVLWHAHLLTRWR